ncbi:TonB-dependent receptor family protein, partial [Nitrospirota bacterium]
MKFLLALFLTCIMVMPALAEQQEDVSELEQITVTATKTPRKVEEVSASVSIVTEEDIENSRGWNVGETLENLPGVQAESKNGAYDTHIIIRGAGAKAQYGVREIMIMVDGIPITDPDSLTRLDMVDTSMIKRIEVVKGPNSTLYGANASGGVINIITKSPLETQGFSLKTSYGSKNSQAYHLQYSGSANDKLYYIISGTRRSTDSWRDWNKFDTSQFNARFNYIIDDDSDIDMTLSHTESNFQLPGSLTKEQFDEDPTQQTSDWVHNGRYSDVQRLALGYRTELDSGIELITKGYLQKWHHYHPVPTGINDGGSTVFGMDFQSNITHSLFDKESTLSVGISTQRDDKKSDKYIYRDINTDIVNGKIVAVTPYTNSDEKGDLMKASTNTVDKWGIFIQDSIYLKEATILDIGLRYDKASFDINSDVHNKWSYITNNMGTSYFNYVPVSETIDIKKDWSSVSPRVGINHALNDATHVYGSVSTGFQTPTQGELETNIDLAPQKALNYEVGIKGRLENGHSYDVTTYYTTLKDEVIKLMDETGSSYFDNAGSTLHKGLEMSGSFILTDTLTLGLGYTYSDFTFVEYVEMEKGYTGVTTHVRDGNRIPLVPKDKYTVKLNYKRPGGFYSNLSGVTW